MTIYEKQHCFVGVAGQARILVGVSCMVVGFVVVFSAKCVQTKSALYTCHVILILKTSRRINKTNKTNKHQ